MQAKLIDTLLLLHPFYSLQILEVAALWRYSTSTCIYFTSTSFIYS